LDFVAPDLISLRLAWKPIPAGLEYRPPLGCFSLARPDGAPRGLGVARYRDSQVPFRVRWKSRRNPLKSLKTAMEKTNGFNASLRRSRARLDAGFHGA